MTTIAEAKIKPAPGIDGVKAYSVPKHPAPIDLKLDANEGGAPDAALLKRIQEIGPDVMRRYPDASAVQRLLAMRNGVEPANLIVTAGADDALDRLCRAVLAPGRELLLTNPSFEMLPRYARIVGASIREVKWWSGAFPTDEMLREIKPNSSGHGHARLHRSRRPAAPASVRLAGRRHSHPRSARRLLAGARRQRQ